MKKLSGYDHKKGKMMRKFIFGTDWFTDCDDAVALRVLTHFVKREKAKLLGIAINTYTPYSVSSVKGFLRGDGIEGIPVGIDRGADDFEGIPTYQKGLSERFFADAFDADAPDAVRLYRRLLADAEDAVEIVETGFLHVIASVLKSGADDISAKSGVELFSEKVSKVWVMAGKWDESGGKEYNFSLNEKTRLGGKEFCALCPVPVTFLGYEIAYDVITGGNLSKDDHLYGVLCDHGSENGRCSWDPMLMLMAMIGDERAAGYDTVCGFARVEETEGKNFFVPDKNGPHRYVVRKYEKSYYEDMINEIL